MTRGEGALLPPEAQELVRIGVQALIAKDRELAAEEIRKASEAK